MRKAAAKLQQKMTEALSAILPILVIVMILAFSVTPIPVSAFLGFLIGAMMLLFGMMFFTLGAELSMTPIGTLTGSWMVKSRKILLILLLSLLLGFVITIAEPDLQVLAGQVQAIPSFVLILTVAAGVGIFLMLALLRMFVHISLQTLLTVFYACVFVLALFVPENMLAVAFDSGGVTTGPMTVPFIMAMGVGVSAIRSDRHAADDSFGLVALCSVGPILAVMALSLIYRAEGGSVTAAAVPAVDTSIELGQLFGAQIPDYLKEMALSLLPVALFFALFQVTVLHLRGGSLKKILVGLAYTYVGLVLFLTGANVGFMPAGMYLGQTIVTIGSPWIVVPVAMVMGFFVVKAEPAVYVLNKQVEEMTDGGISASTMGLSLSIGVAVSLGLSMVRVLTGISILWFLVPGYAAAIAISFFVPKIYTAIAFDSGGVASGPMTAAFLLPFTQGVCLAVGGDLAKDAFGIVAMVAMTPTITIQLLGLISKLREKKHAVLPAPAASGFDALPDDAIIEL